MIRRRRSQAQAFIALTCTLTLAVTSACSSSGGGGGSSSKLSILLSGKSFYDVPLYAMMNDGFAKQQGLTISLAQFNSGGGSTSQIFAGGTGDVLSGGIDVVAAIGASKKVDITVIGAWTQYNYFRLVSKKGSKYQTVADLKGATVGVSGAGSFGDYAVRNALVKAGLTPDKDVKIAALGQPPVQLAALNKGSVQAIMLNPPTIYAALNDDLVQVVHSFEDDGRIPSILFSARTSDVKKNPDAYRKFMDAYRAALAKMKSDPAFATKVANDDWGSSTNATVLKQELTEFLSDPGAWSPDGKFTQELYENGKAMLVGSGQVSADTFPSYSSLVENAPAS
jgi:NitT/TauT family transport system substrate-binding protein